MMGIGGFLQATLRLLGTRRAIDVAIVDGSGNQVTAFGGSGGTASNFGSSFPLSGTAIGAKDSAGANMAALNLDASGFLKVNVAAGGAGGGAVTVADGADAAQGALADAAVTGDNTGSLSAKLRGLSKILFDMWDSVNHRMNVFIQNTTLTVLPGLAISGGYTNTSINAAASNNATSVKGTAGQVYGVHVYNNAPYPVYVKLYNKATAPVPGTDTALLIRRVGVQSGVARDFAFEAGLPFSSGIGLTIVKGIGDTDNTSVLANDCLVELETA